MPDAAPDVRAHLRALLVELGEDKFRLEEIDDAGHLFDHGYIDSLSAVMFLARIEEDLGVVVEDTDLVERLWSVAALAGEIAARREGNAA